MPRLCGLGLVTPLLRDSVLSSVAWLSWHLPWIRSSKEMMETRGLGGGKDPDCKEPAVTELSANALSHL